MRHFNPKQLLDHLENPQANTLLLDVREPWEFDICHIENSVLIPMGTIPNKLDELNKAQEIVVICHHGVRSRQTAMFLEHNGFSNIINLTGGIDAWAQEIDNTMSKY